MQCCWREDELFQRKWPGVAAMWRQLEQGAQCQVSSIASSSLFALQQSIGLKCSKSLTAAGVSPWAVVGNPHRIVAAEHLSLRGLIRGTWGIIHGGNCQVWNWDTTDRSRLLEAATSWLAGYIYAKFSGEYRVKWRAELVSERTYSIIKVYVCYVEEHWGYHWKKTLKLESRISILSWTLYHDAHWLVLVCT